MHLCRKVAAAIANARVVSPNCVRSWAMFAAALAMGLLSGCADSADPVAEKLTPSEDSSSQRAPEVKTVTLGSVGGSLRIDDHTGAIYSVQLRDGAAFLQGAAVLRGETRGWYDRHDSAPGSMQHPGIGASLGKHQVVITAEADVLWADDTTAVPLSDGNIALFEGAGASLTPRGSVSIDPYLGPADIADERQRKALIQGRLLQLLKDSQAVSAAWTD